MVQAINVSELDSLRNMFVAVLPELASANSALESANRYVSDTEAKAAAIQQQFNALLLAGKISVRAVFAYKDPDHKCVYVVKDGETIQENPVAFTATDIALTGLVGFTLYNSNTKEELIAANVNLSLELELLAPGPSKPDWLTDKQAKWLLVFVKLEQMRNQAMSKKVRDVSKIERELAFMKADYQLRSLPELEELIVASGISLEDAYSRNIAIPREP